MKNGIKYKIIITTIAMLLIGCSTEDSAENKKNEIYNNSFKPIDVELDEQKVYDYTGMETNKTIIEESISALKNDAAENVSDNTIAIENAKFFDDENAVEPIDDDYFQYKYTDIHSIDEFNGFDIPDIIMYMSYDIDEKLAGTIYNALNDYCKNNGLDIKTIQYSEHNSDRDYREWFTYNFNISGNDIYVICNMEKGCMIHIY